MRTFRKAHTSTPPVAGGIGPGPGSAPPPPAESAGTAEGPATTQTAAAATEARQARALTYVMATLRLSLGWIFLWAFLDKTFALGFSTGVDAETGAVDRFGDAAWINGGSPTEGYLAGATSGPFADFYQGMAGAVWADWLFMLGLLCLGVALMLGVGMRVCAAAGALLMVLMWSSALPPSTNPFMDDHIVYALLLVALALANAGHTLGIGKQYEKLPIVGKHAWLR